MAQSVLVRRISCHRTHTRYAYLRQSRETEQSPLYSESKHENIDDQQILLPPPTQERFQYLNMAMTIRKAAQRLDHATDRPLSRSPARARPLAQSSQTPDLSAPRPENLRSYTHRNVRWQADSPYERGATVLSGAYARSGPEISCHRSRFWEIAWAESFDSGCAQRLLARTLCAVAVGGGDDFGRAPKAKILGFVHELVVWPACLCCLHQKLCRLSPPF